MTKPILIKIGGHELEDVAFLEGLAPVVRESAAPVVIVHGGGREITTLQQQLGIRPEATDGVRVTDAASMRVVEMVLCGTVNKRIVRVLLAGGVEALGISGVDRGLIRAVKMRHPEKDMGFTGEPTTVRGALLLELLEQGVTPVIAPVSLGPDGALNVNADHAAGAVAVALGARRVVFLTNVAGVLIDGQVAARLTLPQAHSLIADGTILGGMIPKVRTALRTLEQGVAETMITNLAGLKAGSGTVFAREEVEWQS